MKKTGFLIIILAFANAIVPAQVNKIIWSDGKCGFEGTFDAKKFTKTQLKNTHRMFAENEFDLDVTKTRIFKYEDIDKLPTVASLDAEYKRLSGILRKLNIVNMPFWVAFRQKRLKSLEQQYKFARVSVQAYKKPSILKEITFADECLNKFVLPLIAGGDDLLRVWRELMGDNDSNRANSHKEFGTQTAATDKFKLAQVEVIAFGWWDCVNAKIERVENRRELVENFKKLFKNVREISCDEF